MTQRDKFAPSKAASKYYAFRDEIRYLSRLKGIQGIPGAIDAIIFRIPMPQSWSQKKRLEMLSEPHTVRPDLDNYLKALLDALCYEDSHVHTIGKLCKIWDEKGAIEIRLKDEKYEESVTNGLLNFSENYIRYR